MKAFKLPFKFDPVLIQQEIDQFSKKEYYDIYNSYVTLKTLWSKHLIEPINNADGIPEFYPNEALKKCPYLLSIFETFECPVETFRIHQLDAGASIKPHRDIGYSYEQGKIRLHIPVKTNNDVVLLINDTPIHMQPGECWYCNFDKKHEVYNRSNQNRVHLIIDCMVNDWVKTLFDSTTVN